MTAFQGKTIVDADNIVFSYGSRRVIDGLTLSIAAGEIFGLLGANGAGKTTGRAAAGARAGRYACESPVSQ